MAVRDFVATNSDEVLLSIGAVQGLTYGSFAFIFKRAASGQGGVYQSILSSGGTELAWHGVSQFNNEYTQWGANQTAAGTPTFGTEWWLVVWRKATGTVAPAISAYNFNTSTWTHTTTTARADITAIGSTDVIRQKGQFEPRPTGRMAVSGIWKNAVPWADNAAVVAAGLHTSLANWLTSPGITALHPWNQASTAVAVTDLTGNGANQTSITGTTVVTGDDPPGFSFELGSVSLVDPAETFLPDATLFDSSELQPLGSLYLPAPGQVLDPPVPPVATSPAVLLGPSARRRYPTALRPRQSAQAEVPPAPPPPGGGPGGAVVQQVIGSAASAANFTTSNVTTSAANVLAILVGRSGGQGTGALTSVTDPVGNTWTVVTRGSVSGQVNTRVEMWVTTQDVGPLTGQAITCNSGTAQTNDYSILELSGLNKTALVHAASPDNSGVLSATPQTPAVTTTVPTMVFSVIHHSYNAAADTLTSPAGGTRLTDSVNGTVHLTSAAYWPAVAAGSPSGTWARGGAVNGNNGLITAAFTESATAAPGFVGQAQSAVRRRVRLPLRSHSALVPVQASVPVNPDVVPAGIVYRVRAATRRRRLAPVPTPQVLPPELDQAQRRPAPRLSRGRSAQLVPPQFNPPLVPLTLGHRVRAALRRARIALPAPVQALPPPDVEVGQRRRQPPRLLRSRSAQPAPAPVATPGAPALVQAVVGRRLRVLLARRGHTATPIAVPTAPTPPPFVPAAISHRPRVWPRRSARSQSILEAASVPPTSSRRARPGLLRPIRRLRGPVPAAAAAPVNPLLVFVELRRVRGLLLRRSRLAAPVPDQQAVAPNPPWVPAIARRLRLILRRSVSRRVMPIPAQQAPGNPPIVFTRPARTAKVVLRRPSRIGWVPSRELVPVAAHRRPATAIRPRRCRTAMPVPRPLAPPLVHSRPQARPRRPLRRRSRISLVIGAGPPTTLGPVTSPGLPGSRWAGSLGASWSVTLVEDGRWTAETGESGSSGGLEPSRWTGA